VTPSHVHALFEALAYLIGFQTFRIAQRRVPDGALADRDIRWGVVAGAVLGAALGSKLAYWLDDPLGAFAGFPDARALMQGKSIVGGLLGGLIGVETAKRRLRVEQSTGDAFVLPLIVAMIVGRIGCQLGGVGDHTAGLASAVPWAWDHGDGVPRHPTALYEIGFLVVLGTALSRFDGGIAGDRFRLFMTAYLAFRFLVEFLKPVPFAWLGPLSGIQLLCALGLGYYHRDLVRIVRGRAWRTS
jgi:prolipoprotein diacylglyceryltransferase